MVGEHQGVCCKVYKLHLAPTRHPIAALNHCSYRPSGDDVLANTLKASSQLQVPGISSPLTKSGHHQQLWILPHSQHSVEAAMQREWNQRQMLQPQPQIGDTVLPRAFAGMKMHGKCTKTYST